MSEYPRAPRDEAEREACTLRLDGKEGGCSANRSPRRWWCSRCAGHAGDHVAAISGEVLDRWTALPAPTVDEVMARLRMRVLGGDPIGGMVCDADRLRALLTHIRANAPEVLAGAMAQLERK